MAIASNGPQGHFSGKIGNLVYYMLNGKPVVRTIGQPGKPSKAQLANHQGMAVTSKLLKTLAGFIKFGYGLQARGTAQNAHNMATSYHKKHALKGEYPNISIDYANVVLSKGEHPAANDLKIVKKGTRIEISWDPAYGTDDKNYDDCVMVALSFPEIKFGREYLNIARRSEGKCFIELDGNRANQQIEAYIAFKASDNESISDSIYLGNFNGEGKTAEDKNNEKKYLEVKARFDQVAENYLGQIKANHGVIITTKAFRSLKKEYEVLKEKLDKLPGKPG